MGDVEEGEHAVQFVHGIPRSPEPHGGGPRMLLVIAATQDGAHRIVMKEEMIHESELLS
ncbi:MAG TPA: hypothetical protein VGL77_01970 [Armatimonadota bacterium]|jgi:hypothetical protein